MTAYVLSALLATTAAPPAADAIPAAYVQLAHAYQTADEAALRTLLSSDFEYVLVFGPSENRAQYIADWNETKKSSPSLRVDVRITRLDATAVSADTEILLTQTSGAASHAIVDTQRERDRWKLRNGAWALVSAQTVTDTVAIDDKIVSDDGPFTPLKASKRAAVVAQLKELAWPIETALPGNSSADLDPLYDAIGSARIVGMGEGTHGTSEFFTLKDRIFRFLVEKMGFTVFAMEMPWIDGLAIDRYVTTGRGNARAALSRTFAVWNNQEVLDLIQWMRAYNVTRGNRPELRFVAIDMQDNPSTLRDIILRFVKAAHPADLDQTVQRLACLKPITVGSTATGDCDAGVAAVATQIAGEAATSSLPRDAVLQAVHASQVAFQIAQMEGSPDAIDQTNSRDRSMAENLRWFSTTMFPGARIALWAHDGHVMSTNNQGMITMGAHLRRLYGTNYYVIGFAFDRGSVSPNGVRTPVTVEADPPQALGGVLRLAGEPLFGLNLRPLSPQTPLGEYLGSDQPMRMLGAFNAPTDLNPSQSYAYVNVKKSFDTLIFVETMHSAHSFGVRRKAAMRTFTVPPGAGGVTWPTHWSQVGFDPTAYRAGGDAPSAAFPAGLLWLSSISGSATGVTSGTIPVAAYRGKRLRVSGDLEVSGADSGAGAWARADDATGKGVSYDTMQDRVLRGTTGWTPFTLTVDVPKDSHSIAFGLWLYGDGWLWATNLKLETVDQPK